MAERLTLDEAIKHCEEKADCTQCGEEHRQLAEWLRELQKYQDLKEQGRVVELPCKIGDTVWDIRWWDDTTETRVIDGKTYFRRVMKHKVTKSKFKLFDYDNFGKTVFLTKKEAEAALKEVDE